MQQQILIHYQYIIFARPQAYSKKKSVVKVDKNGNSDLATGNGQVANGHTSILANGGETDIRQRKLA